MVTVLTGGCGGDDGPSGPGGPDAAPPTADTVAPSFSGATEATPLPSAVRVQWTTASDNVSANNDIVYLIYMALASGAQDFNQVTLETPPGATSASISGLELATTYYVVVRARDAAGNVDDNTVEVSATTLDVADNSPPTFAGVDSAEAIGTTAVSLGWQAADDDVADSADIRYRVYFADTSAGQDFATPYATTAAGATEALVTGLTPDTTYYFVVRAVDLGDNEDDNTTEQSITTAASVSFAADVEPILAGTCTSPGCHGGARPAQELDLQAGNAYASLVGVTAGQCLGRLRVSAGAPEASYLVNKLDGVDLCAGTQMPKSGSLPAAQRQIIRDWIAAGALDD
ncbi:fibronectin type III domain-containing protein [Haliangium sp.]|uniref:fibronectin type III domain-containing protein n=1 Tax=Haliangium sp. TaxID=2663208 RepID=UPI003D0DFDB8